MRKAILIILLVPQLLFGRTFMVGGQKPIPGDLNGDGVVDILDFAIMANNWLVGAQMNYPEKLQASGAWQPYEAVNGVYVKDGEHNGKPEYVNSNARIRWVTGFEGSRWIIKYDGSTLLNGPNTPDDPTGDYTSIGGTVTVIEYDEDNDMMMIKNVDMTGSAVEYTVPDDVASIAIQARGGDIEVRDSAASSEYWTLAAGSKEAIGTRTVAGQKFWFTGASSTVLEVRMLTGLLS